MNKEWHKYNLSIINEYGFNQLSISESIKNIEQWLFNEGHKKILDLGCGSGRHNFLDKLIKEMDVKSMIYRKCNNCLHKFSNKQIIQSVWLFGYDSIDCKFCGTRFYPTLLARTFVAINLALPVTVFNLLKYYDSWDMLIYFAWLGVIILITPYIATFKLKHEQ